MRRLKLKPGEVGVTVKLKGWKRPKYFSLSRAMHDSLEEYCFKTRQLPGDIVVEAFRRYGCRSYPDRRRAVRKFLLDKRNALSSEHKEEKRKS